MRLLILENELSPFAKATEDKSPLGKHVFSRMFSKDFVNSFLSPKITNIAFADCLSRDYEIIFRDCPRIRLGSFKELTNSYLSQPSMVIAINSRMMKRKIYFCFKELVFLLSLFFRKNCFYS
jgi:hypothetical protein